MDKLTATFPQNLSLRFVLLVMLAGLGIVLTQVTWQRYQESREDVMRSNGEIMQLADSVVAHQQRVIDRVTHELGALGGFSIGQQLNASQCDSFLSRQLESFPEYDNIAFVGMDGVVQCSAHPVSRIFYPVIPLLKGAFTKKPLLIPMGGDHLLFAAPHISSEGKVIGTVVVFLPSFRFFARTRFKDVGSAALGLIDGSGSIVTAYPSFESWKAAFQHNPLFPKSLLEMETNAVVRLSWAEGMQGAFIAKPVRGFANAMMLVVRSPADEAGTAFARNAALMASVLVFNLLIFVVLGSLVGKRLVYSLNQIRWELPPQLLQWRDQFQEMWTKALMLVRGSVSRIQGPVSELNLRKAYETLKRSQKLEEERVRQIVRLDQLSQGLQGCVSTAEVADMVAQCAQEMFPGSGGALLLKAAPDLVETVKGWGGSIHQEAFRPSDCWALRTGRPYRNTQPNGVNCAHLKGAPEHYICMPLIALGELFGVLHLDRLAGERGNVGSTSESVLWSTKSIAERVAIAISAVRQQERLRFRATRDVLTGLFNRRFMEEAMEIEQRRALRRGSPIGFMMVDVDHFKLLNDTFGHDSGDAVLRMIGSVLRHIIREGDMPCRYGGEEFVVILPGATLEDTRQRAETLRMAIERCRPNHEGRALGQVTVSIGVSVFPVNGSSWQMVLKSADQALYNAKRSGRNRVVSLLQAPALTKQEPST